MSKVASKKTTVAKKVVDDSTGRHFKVSDPKLEGGEFFGRFSGKTPKQAASKAFTSILKARADAKISASGKIHYSVYESTQNSKHKTFHYVGQRAKLTPPTQVSIKGADGSMKTITYHFQNNIMEDKDAKNKAVAKDKAAAKDKADKAKAAKVAKADKVRAAKAKVKAAKVAKADKVRAAKAKAVAAKAKASAKKAVAKKASPAKKSVAKASPKKSVAKASPKSSAKASPKRSTKASPKRSPKRSASPKASPKRAASSKRATSPKRK